MQLPTKPGSYEASESYNKLSCGLFASACALAVLISIAMLSVLAAPQVAKLGGLNQPNASTSLENWCSVLKREQRVFCVRYVAAEGEDRWTAAAAWRWSSADTYACSGIEAHCLQQDMLQTTTSSSRCKPLLDGRRCNATHRCRQGYCAGAAPANTATGKAVGSTSTSDTQQTPAALRRSSSDEGGSKNIFAAVGEPDDMILDPTHRILAEPAMPTTQEPRGSAGPVPEWPFLAISVDTNNTTGRRVPATFLATSHEYTRIVDYGDAQSVASWANVFNMLSSSPVIRVGGASQDKLTTVPGREVWQALSRLNAATNCRFIFGLPLWQQNAVEMSKQIINMTQKYFGEAVIAYELGNEPEFWPTGLGGYDTQGHWVSGFEAYAGYFQRVAQALNPCSLGKKKLSGPGWGNVNTQPTGWWARTLWAGKDCYLAEANTHYYPYVDNHSVTASQLLSQQLQDLGLEKYHEYQRLANSAKLPLRISETNSLYGGGRTGLSDTFVGALWVADAVFEFAKTGAVGYHLHWGIGGHPTQHLGSPNVGVQTNYYYTVNGTKLTHEQIKELNVNSSKLGAPVPYPSVHAPWYGYLFWTVAAHGDYYKTADTAFVPVAVSNAVSSDSWRPRVQQEQATVGCSANIKVHALKSTGGDLRVAIINKDQSSSCNVQVKVPSSEHAQQAYCTHAFLGRLLPDPAGLHSKAGVSWQGQIYDQSGFAGVIQGNKKLQQLQATRIYSSLCVFEVGIEASSAALLVVKPEWKAQAVN